MKTAFVLTHTTGKVGSLNTLLTFMKERDIDLYLLSHPLDDYSRLPTTFQDPFGKLEEHARKPRGIFNLLEDFMISVKYISASQFDVFLGVSNFDTLPALFCRYILRKQIPRIIYYPCDYSEDRFGNPILNFAYNLVERFVVMGADVTISNTRRAEEQRLKRGLKPRRSLVIPNPVMIPKPDFLPKEIDKNKFIYVGDISNEHGLYDIIESLGTIIKKLTIIGSGSDEQRTIHLAKSKGFELELLGYRPHDEVMKHLQDFNGIGLAPYTLASKWTYYASPLKVSEYIASGVPVLVSNVPEVSAIIEQQRLGVVYDQAETDSIKVKIDAFDTKHFSAKAETFYNEQNYRTVFENLPL